MSGYHEVNRRRILDTGNLTTGQVLSGVAVLAFTLFILLWNWFKSGKDDNDDKNGW